MPDSDPQDGFFYLPLTHMIDTYIVCMSVKAQSVTQSVPLCLVLVSIFQCHGNRKEGNDQKSIQLHSTFRPRHQRERRTHLKQRHHNQNISNRKPKGQFLFQNICQMAIQNKNFTRTYTQRHTMTEIVNHSRSTTLERSVKTYSA